MSAAIVATENTYHGEPRFYGTRVPLRIVLNALHDGATPDEVSRMYASLPDGWFELLQALAPFLRRRFREDVR